MTKADEAKRKKFEKWWRETFAKGPATDAAKYYAEKAWMAALAEASKSARSSNS